MVIQFSRHTSNVHSVKTMELFELTRQLIDIESITGNEKNVAVFVRDHLAKLGAQV